MKVRIYDAAALLVLRNGCWRIERHAEQHVGRPRFCARGRPINPALTRRVDGAARVVARLVDRHAAERRGCAKVLQPLSIRDALGERLVDRRSHRIVVVILAELGPVGGTVELSSYSAPCRYWELPARSSRSAS